MATPFPSQASHLLVSPDGSNTSAAAQLQTPSHRVAKSTVALRVMGSLRFTPTYNSSRVTWEKATVETEKRSQGPLGISPVFFRQMLSHFSQGFILFYFQSLPLRRHFHAFPFIGSKKASIGFLQPPYSVIDGWTDFQIPDTDPPKIHTSVPLKPANTFFHSFCLVFCLAFVHSICIHHHPSIYGVHWLFMSLLPGKLTCPLKIKGWKTYFLLK